jgi:hypothetical protein
VTVATALVAKRAAGSANKDAFTSSGDTEAAAPAKRWAAAFDEVLRTSSSQTSMCERPVERNYLSVAQEHQALVDMKALMLLRHRIELRAW